MREQVLKSSDGRIFQVLTDGRSVWVNAYDGSAVGRFGPGGVDVHRPVNEQREKGQCLDCVPADKSFGSPARELWERFRRRMREFYGLELGDEWEPGSVRQIVAGALEECSACCLDDEDDRRRVLDAVVEALARLR